LSSTLADLAGSPASLTLDGLRLLERKTATVCTLLKASVYSIVLQQQIINEGEDARQHRQQQDDYMDGPSVLSTMMMGGGAGGEGDTITH
jgi:DASH complex subunit DAD3